MLGDDEPLHFAWLEFGEAARVGAAARNRGVTIQVGGERVEDVRFRTVHAGRGRARC